jgi:hypothetical protein
MADAERTGKNGKWKSGYCSICMMFLITLVGTTSYYPGMKHAQFILGYCDHTVPSRCRSCPWNYPTPASCPMKPSRCCVCAPCGASSWAPRNGNSLICWASAMKPSAAGGPPTCAEPNCGHNCCRIKAVRILVCFKPDSRIAENSGEGWATVPR